MKDYPFTMPRMALLFNHFIYQIIKTHVCKHFLSLSLQISVSISKESCPWRITKFGLRMLRVEPGVARWALMLTQWAESSRFWKGSGIRSIFKWQHWGFSHNLSGQWRPLLQDHCPFKSNRWAQELEGSIGAQSVVFTMVIVKVLRNLRHEGAMQWNGEQADGIKKFFHTATGVSLWDRHVPPDDCHLTILAMSRLAATVKLPEPSDIYLPPVSESYVPQAYFKYTVNMPDNCLISDLDFFLSAAVQCLNICSCLWIKWPDVGAHPQIDSSQFRQIFLALKLLPHPHHHRKHTHLPTLHKTPSPRGCGIIPPLW